jgi:hypothetical protein
MSIFLRSVYKAGKILEAQTSILQLGGNPMPTTHIFQYTKNLLRAAQA